MKNINLIYSIIKQNSKEKQLKWVDEKACNYSTIQISFVGAPRFVGKQKLNAELLSAADSAFQNWRIDQLVRVYLLLVLENNTASDIFSKQMEMLFETAEINESVALFSALPYFQNPHLFIQKATDAVRSNIGDIFDSIAFENAFPSKYFTELAWNQLVLKCIFNDKPIHRIIGLEKRANQNLANTLSDFAHERWAAGRSVSAQAWRLVTNFINDTILKDIETLFTSNNENNKIAAAIVVEQSTNQAAKGLFEKYFSRNDYYFKDKLSWEYLENIK